MTREEILTMWVEASGTWAITPEIERFAALVAEWEREECAKLCDAQPGQVDAYAFVAKAIRNRSKPEREAA